MNKAVYNMQPFEEPALSSKDVQELKNMLTASF